MLLLIYVNYLKYGIGWCDYSVDVGGFCIDFVIYVCGGIVVDVVCYFYDVYGFLFEWLVLFECCEKLIVEYIVDCCVVECECVCDYFGGCGIVVVVIDVVFVVCMFGFNMWMSLKVVVGEVGYGGFVVVFVVCVLGDVCVVVVDMCYVDFVFNGGVKM